MKPEVSIRINNEEQMYKQALADAVYHAVNLLKEEGVISVRVLNVISAASKEIGCEICRRVKDIAEDIELVQDEEVMHRMDTNVEGDFEEVPEPARPYEEESLYTSSSTNEEEDSQDVHGGKKNPQHRVSWETKVKAVTLARMHPKWSLDTIRRKATRFLRTRNQLWRWKQAVDRKGSSPADKQKIIDDWTYKRFMGARSRKRLVTTKMLQQWATEPAKEFHSERFQFQASRAWVDKFQRDRNILQRRIIRFIKKADLPMLEIMLP